MTLESVQTFRVPFSIVDATGEALREAGGEGYELFVLWSGAMEGDRTLRIMTHHIPEQKSYKTPDGLLVRVEGPALHRLNATLYESGEVLAVQVHAHPTDAFHSRTDSSFPIVTTMGGLSIVAPDFAMRGVLTRGTAAYRLAGTEWQAISRRRLRRTVQVEDD